MRRGSWVRLLALVALATPTPRAAASCLPGHYMPPPPIARFVKLQNDIPAELLDAWEGYGLQD